MLTDKQDTKKNNRSGDQGLKAERMVRDSFSVLTKSSGCEKPTCVKQGTFLNVHF